MKRLILTAIFTLMIITISFAGTITIVEPAGLVTSTTPTGAEVTLYNFDGNIRWWKVIRGGIDIIENKFIMPEGNVEIQAMYTGGLITVLQCENGTISPGSVGVEVNQNKTFTITAEPGYLLSDVIVDGESQGAIPSYEFINVTENHTITATFIEREKKKLIVEHQSGNIVEEEIPMGKLVTLNAQDNGMFTKWESNDVVIQNPTNRTITFAMPEKDARIVARGGKTSNKLITSVDGINKTTVTKNAGDVITLTADTTGDYFLYWRVNGVELGNQENATISFTMPPNDVTVVAVYKDRLIRKLVVEQPSGAIVSRMVVQGSPIEITVDDSEVFTRWESSDIAIQNPTSETISFEMPGKEVRIVARGGKTVNNLTSSLDGINKTTITKNAGETVTLTADTWNGYFMYWRANGVELANPENATISFTMPNNDVTVIPVYRDRLISDLIVEINAGNSNPYFVRKEMAGKEITLTAPEANGATFIGWEVNGVEIQDPTQRTITFVMPNIRVRATAVYE